MCATEQQIWPPLLIVNDVTMSESFSPNKAGVRWPPPKHICIMTSTVKKESAGWPLSRHSRLHLTYQMYCVMLQRSPTTCRRGKRQFSLFYFSLSVSFDRKREGEQCWNIGEGVPTLSCGRRIARKWWRNICRLPTPASGGNERQLAPIVRSFAAIIKTHKKKRDLLINQRRENLSE
jgi:hypothetical protein